MDLKQLFSGIRSEKDIAKASREFRKQYRRELQDRRKEAVRRFRETLEATDREELEAVCRESGDAFRRAREKYSRRPSDASDRYVEAVNSALACSVGVIVSTWRSLYPLRLHKIIHRVLSEDGEGDIPATK